MLFWKFIFAIGVTAVAFVLASVIPACGYFLWQWINPVSETGRIVLGLGMVFLGGGFTIASWIAVFALWGTMMAAIYSTPSGRRRY